MFIGYFTETPWQDERTGMMGQMRLGADLLISNSLYDSQAGAKLYHRYFDEKMYIDEVGFDGVMLNEHHNSPFCMQGVTTVGASILARITKNVKLCILGNMIPVWDDPLWLAESLAMIDMISNGRLVSGWVRGTGRESVAHDSNPAYNWERYQEAHDFIVKTWTTPGPFRWEGKHYQFRYVNPWAVPLQRPHPPIWIPGAASRATVRWAASNHYPYVMLGGELGLVRKSFDFYEEVAQETGWKAGTEHIMYMFKCHVDETEELAEATARKFLGGVINPFIEGNEGESRPWIMGLPGLNPRTADSRMPVSSALPRSRGGSGYMRSFEEQAADYNIVYGTPTSILPKIRHIMETLRTGGIIFWDGDGAMNHDDAMRSIRLFGSEIIPAVREMGKEMGLTGPYDVDPVAGMTPGLESKMAPLTVNGG